MDEHNTADAVSLKTSLQPLDIRQMVHVLRERASNSLLEPLRQVPLEEQHASEEAVGFALGRRGPGCGGCASIWELVRCPDRGPRGGVIHDPRARLH